MPDFQRDPSTGRIVKRRPASVVSAEVPLAGLTTGGDLHPDVVRMSQTAPQDADQGKGPWLLQLEELCSVATALEKLCGEIQRTNPNMQEIQFVTKDRWGQIVRDSAIRLRSVAAASEPVKKAS